MTSLHQTIVFKLLRTTLFATGLLLAGATCLANTAQEPTSAKFIWGDLFTDSPEAAIEFYTSVFGWTSQKTDDESYSLLINDKTPVCGVAYHTSDKNGVQESHTRWIGYIAVADVAQTVSLVEKEGGKQLFGPQAIPDRGTIAIVSDNEDSLVGLLESDSSLPQSRKGETGFWIWVQMFSKAPENSVAFYHNVFGYDVTVDPRTNIKNDYLLSSNGTPQAALSPLPMGVDSSGGWLGVVHVEDVSKSIAKAKMLGGTLLNISNKNEQSENFAIITDPFGGAIGLYSTPTDTPNAN